MATRKVWRGDVVNRERSVEKAGLRRAGFFGPHRVVFLR